MLIKLSILFLYLTIFRTTKWLRYSAYAGIIVLIICHIASCLIIIISCRPIAGTSQLSFIAGLSSEQCTKGGKFGMFQSSMNLIGDVYLMVVPLPAVWSLQMQTRKKIGITAMFATGLM